MNRRDFLTGLGAIPLLAVVPAVNVQMKSSATVSVVRQRIGEPTNHDAFCDRMAQYIRTAKLNTIDNDTLTRLAQ